MPKVKKPKKVKHLEVIGFSLLFGNREPHTHMFKTPISIKVGDTFNLDWHLEIVDDEIH